MKKLRWGNRIAILYIGFVATIILMVIVSMNQKIELVSDDYYEQELAFQNKINEANNANALSEKIDHQFTDNGIVFQFPSQFKNQLVTGDILFFRPSDATKDYKQLLKLDTTGKCFVNSKMLSKGMYKVKINWSANNTNYFTEQIIVVP